MEAYQRLEKQFGDLLQLKQVEVLLDWDRSVMMPEAGGDARARQMALMNVLMHERLTDPKVAQWLKSVDRKPLNEWQQANVEMMEWLHAHETALTAEQVEKKTFQENKTELVWRRARAESNFKLVQDDLSRLVDLVREQAAAKSKRLGKPAYESLMDSYAPHMTVPEVDAIFDDLAAFLPGFITSVIDSQQDPLPLPAVPVEKQEKFGQQLAQMLGFERSWSRLDVSAHPFSMGIGGDVRITTRYNENDFMNSIQGVTHECGHGFYDHNTPAEWQHQPVGRSQNMGMAIHESQSLSLDMQLGRSRAYWDALSPHLQKAFGVSGPEWSGENLYRHATRVERGFIRVDADEVTYPAHVILRYRLERKMVEGTLEVKDLPHAWNAEMQALLGVTPPDDRRGCLQDIHWYSGAFGYFPAYALGAIIAAQFVCKMRRDQPGIEARVAQGDFGAFVGWLKDNVQRHACLYKPQDLIRKVTGEGLSAHYFKKHLHERYLGGEKCSTTSAQDQKRRA